MSYLILNFIYLHLLQCTLRLSTDTYTVLLLTTRYKD